MIIKRKGGVYNNYAPSSPTEACWITLKGIVQDSLLLTVRYRPFCKPVVTDRSLKPVKHRWLELAFTITNYLNTGEAKANCAFRF